MKPPICSLFLLPALLQAATFSMNPGESIQDALDGARPGDVVRIAAGTYRERIQVNVSGTSSNTKS